MLTIRDFITGIRSLEIDRTAPIIFHASLLAFGEVRGGADTLLGGISTSFDTFIMPVFTYRTMVTPELGPPDNAIAYGSGIDTNRMAEFFSPNLPADPIFGSLAKTLLSHPKVVRSSHPILSFAGINAAAILERQTLDEPFRPIQALRNASGWVLLMGVDQTANTSIHFAEQLAGRKQFIRWALTSQGVVPCPKFPGCSDGFEAIAPRLETVTRGTQVGEGIIQAMPLGDLVDTVCMMIKEDPAALLCDRKDCTRCNAVRASI